MPIETTIYQIQYHSKDTGGVNTSPFFYLKRRSIMFHMHRLILKSKNHTFLEKIKLVANYHRMIVEEQKQLKQKGKTQ